MAQVRESGQVKKRLWGCTLAEVARGWLRRNAYPSVPLTP